MDLLKNVEREYEVVLYFSIFLLIRTAFWFNMDGNFQNCRVDYWGTRMSVQQQISLQRALFRNCFWFL
jgi:hypothetical protein